MPKVIKGIDIPSEKLKAGTVIFEEGSEASCFYIIKIGQVDIFKNHGKPNEFHIATIGPGSVLGEISGIDRQPRWATAVAKNNIEVSKVATQAIQYQLQQCPGWFRAIILDIVERFRTADELLVKYGLEARHSTHTMSSLKPTAE